MPYAVTVVGEVARLRAGDSGSRNVRVNRGTPEERLLTFNRMPTYLETVPPEVEADRLLVVREVTQEEMDRAGGRLLVAPNSNAAEVDPEDEDDLEVDEVDDDALVVTGTDDPDKVNKSNMRRPPSTPARRPGRPRKAAKE